MVYPERSLSLSHVDQLVPGWRVGVAGRADDAELTQAPEATPPRGDQRHTQVVRVRQTGIASWWIYDWANSAFGTLITTFIFASYFASAVAPDPTQGTVLWGRASSIGALLVALLSPPLGAIADRGGGRKTWLFVTTVACVAFTACLYLVAPSTDFVPLALCLFVGGLVFSEMSLVFYNSMLPSIAPPNRLGFVSGWGLGIGFLGGVVALTVALLLFISAGSPFASLARGNAENVRATALLVAAWYAVFSIPLFLWTPQHKGTAKSAKDAVISGLTTLGRTFRQARRHANIIRFLLSFLFYANGVGTVFAFGGIYAVGTFAMSTADVTKFAIALNVAAACGAAAFSWIDDWIGPKRTLLFSIAGLIASGTVLVLTKSIIVFWIAGIVLSALIGAAQAVSRAFMARLAPGSMETEMFGLYALSGKATAFAGPLVLALVTDAFDSQRAGMATVLGFFALGFVLLLWVKEPSVRGIEVQS
jgi:UMF1 family MFS transporter